MSDLSFELRKKLLKVYISSKGCIFPLLVVTLYMHAAMEPHGGVSSLTSRYMVKELIPEETYNYNYSLRFEFE